MRGRFLSLIGFLVLAAAPALTQIQELHVSDLPVRTAQSKDPTAVLAASLETLLQDPDICCRKGSSLEDAVQSADPFSLKDVAGKLQGRRVLPDGRPIMITTDYRSASSISPEWIIGYIANNRALLMKWNSHLYVLYGVTFNPTIYGGPDGGAQQYNVILKLSLADLRFSDERREKPFDRAADDWNKVQEFLVVSYTPQ